MVIFTSACVAVVDASFHADVHRRVGRPKSNSHGSVSWRLRSVRHSVWLFLRSHHCHGDGLHRGKYIANKFSEKKMTILGGSVFLASHGGDVVTRSQCKNGKSRLASELDGCRRCKLEFRLL